MVIIYASLRSPGYDPAYAYLSVECNHLLSEKDVAAYSSSSIKYTKSEFPEAGKDLFGNNWTC